MADHAAVIEAARQLGDVSRGGDAQLWTEVLEYFGGQDWDCSAQASCTECSVMMLAARKLGRGHTGSHDQLHKSQDQDLAACLAWLSSESVTHDSSCLW